MPEFDLVAMGGTFDIIHKGHISLISKAFEKSSKVIIGLTSDNLAEKKGKSLNNSYSKRKEKLIQTIEESFPNSIYEIRELKNDFGPAVLRREVQALIVSEETSYQGNVLNSLRKERNLPPVSVVVVPMVMAADGKRISTTRIKNSEIDTEGNL